VLETAKVDTGPIITHSASLEGIGPAIERVLQREDEVVKTVIKP
jgi:threonine dehydrogenase-like Zn-dependent dehydrogenase